MSAADEEFDFACEAEQASSESILAEVASQWREEQLCPTPAFLDKKYGKRALEDTVVIYAIRPARTRIYTHAPDATHPTLHTP